MKKHIHQTRLFAAVASVLFAAGALLSPPPVLAQPSTNGLLLWLDSSYSDSVVRDAGGRVTAWLNKAPGANNAVSYTGNNDNNTFASYNAVPPNYVAGPNGVGVVNFTGNGYLDNLAFSSQTPADLTVFLLATASTNLGGFSAWMAFNQSQSANDWQTGLNIDQGQYPSTTLNRLNVEGAKGGGNGGFQLVNGSLNFGTYYVFEIDYGGGPANNHSLVTAMVGGASVASLSESPNTVALNNFYLGTRGYFSGGYNNTDNHDLVGQIAAVLVYDHQLTGSDLTQAQSYLSNFFLLTNLSTTSSTQPNSFTYNNFVTAKLIRFNGSATKATTSDGPVLQLTPASANQAGSAFTSNHIVLAPNSGFGTFFTFRLSHPGNTQDGGVSFTIQSAGSSSLGGSGSGLGYSGITKSLSVGFGADNQVSVSTNGVLNAASVNTNPVNDGNIWYAWVDYEGVSQNLEVRLSEIPVRPLTNILATTVNLPAIVGNTNVYVGFTGATGAGWNQQDILSWKFMALPTSRITGHYALSNVPPHFHLTNGIVLKTFKYQVNVVWYTNFYIYKVAYVENPDGTVDFTTPPNSNPISKMGSGTGSNIGSAQTDAADIEEEDESAFSEYGVFDDNGNVIIFGVTVAPTFSSLQQLYDYYDALSISKTGLTEAEYEFYDEQLNASPPEPLSPPPAIVQLEEGGITTGGSTLPIPLTSSADEDGNYNYETYTFSSATNRGSMTARRQLIDAPPLPLNLVSPRMAGTNFIFDFLTVSNQGYTVWANPNLATTNWVSYTNLLGDGYIQKMTVPITNSTKSFYRLSSP